ncbi:MAG: hypothetical protein JKX84_08425 [Flavobacteriales bacterium]|nr:hypothetical protein [Flavobacteriales bacterium]
MKKCLFIFVLHFLAFTSHAKEDFSLTIYKTYEEYQSKKGEQLFDFIGYDWTMGSLHLFYRVKRRDEGKVKVTTAYGFTVGDQFYCIIKGRPYRMLMQGKVVYYENGIAHLNMLIGDDNSSEVELGGWSFLSENLTSEIIEFPSAKADKAFGQKPALQPLFECMKKLKKKKTEKIRDCVKENI